MRNIVFAISLTLLGYSGCFAQLNDYKYLVVPIRFQDFNNDNQHRTSTLIKYLFTNEGFNTVYSNNLPEELRENPCLGLRVDLLDGSSLFSTKTQLSLKDCNGVVVLTSQEGRSKVKEYEQAYLEAISESFGSFRGLNYVYKPREENTTSTEKVTVSFKNDVKSLEEPEKMAESNKNTISEVTPGLTFKTEKGVLYAQPIEGGYQLIDSAPKVVYILKATSSPDVFLVSKDGQNGVVFKNEDKWFVEMDEKGGKAKELNIKF